MRHLIASTLSSGNNARTLRNFDATQHEASYWAVPQEDNKYVITHFSYIAGLPTPSHIFPNCVLARRARAAFPLNLHHKTQGLYVDVEKKNASGKEWDRAWEITFIRGCVQSAASYLFIALSKLEENWRWKIG